MGKRNAHAKSVVVGEEAFGKVLVAMQAYAPSPEELVIWDDGSHRLELSEEAKKVLSRSMSYVRRWGRKDDYHRAGDLPSYLRFEGGRLAAAEFISGVSLHRSGGKPTRLSFTPEGLVDLIYFSENGLEHRMEGPTYMVAIGKGLLVEFAVWGEVVESLFLFKSDEEARMAHLESRFIGKDFRLALPGEVSLAWIKTLGAPSP